MKKLAIRAEDKNQWERRTPLVPEHVAQVLASNTGTIVVQESPIRIYSESDYRKVGASIAPTIDDADIIIGVKEIPAACISEEKVYLYFSHTIKGQQANMEMLRTIINKKSTLLDYEKIVDDNGRRLIFFGKFAGDAGAVDILWLLGKRLQDGGIKTSFSQIKQALNYQSLDDALEQITRIAETVSLEGWPREIQPFVIGILGYGNVSQGAQEVLHCFPVKEIHPSDLGTAKGRQKLDPRKLNLVIFHEEDMVRHRGGKKFELNDYYMNPQDYEPITEQYIPWVTVLVNAVYWEKQYPRFLTRSGLQQMHHDGKLHPFFSVADLSCDPHGAIEVTTKTTESGDPAYIYDPESDSIRDSTEGQGVLILAVDNLPCEFSMDSSKFFSHRLLPFIEPLMNADFSQHLETSGLPMELQRAVIVKEGKLTPPFLYLNDFLTQ